jgi:hypothetical protein
MSQPSLLNILDLVELQFNEVSVVLMDENPEQLALACAAMQRLSVDFMQMLVQRGRGVDLPSSVTLRLQTLAQGIVVLRANLLRCAALVEQSLKVVVPTVADATYGQASSPYGAIARQTGAFKVLAA